jgi:hypothetical protein
MKSLVLSSLLSVPLLASAMVTNGDVEMDPLATLVNGHWRTYASGTPWGDLVPLSPGGGGSSFVYFDVDGPNSGTLTLPVTIAADGMYFFGGYLLQTGSGRNNPADANWTLTVDAGSKNGTVSTSSLVPVDTWNKVEGTQFLTMGSHTLTFTFTSEPGIAKDIAVDDFYVTAVPEVESFALMAAGLAAVGFLARRRSRAA